MASAQETFENGRAAGDEGAEAREVGGAPQRGPRERIEQIRVAELDRHTVAFYQVEDLFGVRAPGDHHRTTSEKHRQHRDASAAGAEEGRGCDRHVITAQIETRQAVDDVPGDVRVAQHDAFRRARGSGGERQQAKFVESKRHVDGLVPMPGDELLVLALVVFVLRRRLVFPRLAAAGHRPARYRQATLAAPHRH